jgi:two-component system LytT family response regulator
MIYKTILIDDEPLALQRLERLLKPYEEIIQIIGQATSGTEAVEKINSLKPDLIFLDIQMPELTGFDVIERMMHNPLIIFSTAYDEFALKAFETNSIDYLLKPIDPDRLRKAIEKLQRLTNDERDSFQNQLQKMLSQLKKPATKRIQVHIGDKIKLLNVEDIYFFHAVDKYVEVCTFNEAFLLNETLTQLESELPPEDFVRIHRSAIINLNYVGEFIRWFGGSYKVRMLDKNKTELPVSRSSKDKLNLT